MGNMSEQIRLAVIGAGHLGRIHARLAQQVRASSSSASSTRSPKRAVSPKTISASPS